MTSPGQVTLGRGRCPPEPLHSMASMRLCVLSVCGVLLAGSAASGADPARLFEQPWQWKDERAETVTFARWLGEPVVLTMFFRSCEARCAPTVERLKKLEQ